VKHVSTAVIAGLVWSASSYAAAQSREIDVGASVGTGISIGTGDARAVSKRSPLFLDLGARTWNDESPDFSWGGSLRLEVEGRASVGIVPRAELPRSFGPVTVRAIVGAPIFFAPFTLLGAEAGATATWKLAPRVGLFAALLFDAYVLGSDLPEGGALIMCNGALGVELDPT
jgi:hypothetical protein